MIRVTEQAIHYLKSLINIPDTDIQTAYNAGYDCGTNGATLQNCHFSLFSSLAAADAWNEGSADAKAGRSNRYNQP